MTSILPRLSFGNDRITSRSRARKSESVSKPDITSHASTFPSRRIRARIKIVVVGGIGQLFQVSFP